MRVVVTDEKPDAANTDADKLSLALSRFDLIKEGSSEDRKLRLEDLKFRVGDQWPEDTVRDRNADQRPALTINRQPQFVRLITNDMRQNRPQITVSPTDGDATAETARVIQGMVRHIEVDSNADYAYDTAGDGQCISGLGFFRVTTQYEDPKSFDQIIKIKRIRNSFSVYCDLSVLEPDYSDMKYCFLTEDLTKAEYKVAYPASKLSTSAVWEGDGNPIPGWLTKEGCRVAEYFYVDSKETTIYLLDNRDVVEKSEITFTSDNKPIPPKGRTIMGERQTQIPVVKWFKMNGVEILEETEWLGDWIPVIPVIGDELEVDGKIIYEGVVRHSKDSQRMYNYWASAETEMIALAPKAPWIGAEGQFTGHEEKWKVANRKNLAYLEYKPVSFNGAAEPPPQRNVQEAPVRAITQARQLAAEDMKATTGTFDPALGEKGNETSGVAILQRKMQHGTSNFHYSDNMSRAIRHLGRILINLIPKVYDSDRVIRIINPDGTSDTVTINKTFKDEGGVERMFDVRVGKYDVVVSAGPSYATKRQETVATMVQLAMADPGILQIAGDLMVKNMDWEGANEIAERMKKMLPPQLQDGSDISPAAQQQITQLRGLVQKLTTALNATSAKLETKVMDIQSKERIALNKNLTDLVIVAEQMSGDAAKTAFTTMTDHINQQLDRVGENQDPDTAANTGAAQLNPAVAAATQPPAAPQQPQQGDGT